MIFKKSHTKKNAQAVLELILLLPFVILFVFVLVSQTTKFSMEGSEIIRGRTETMKAIQSGENQIQIPEGVSLQLPSWRPDQYLTVPTNTGLDWGSVLQSVLASAIINEGLKMLGIENAKWWQKALWSGSTTYVLGGGDARASLAAAAGAALSSQDTGEAMAKGLGKTIESGAALPMQVSVLQGTMAGAVPAVITGEDFGSIMQSAAVGAVQGMMVSNEFNNWLNDFAGNSAFMRGAMRTSILNISSSIITGNIDGSFNLAKIAPFLIGGINAEIMKNVQNTTLSYTSIAVADTLVNSALTGRMSSDAVVTAAAVGMISGAVSGAVASINRAIETHRDRKAETRAMSSDSSKNKKTENLKQQASAQAKTSTVANNAGKAASNSTSSESSKTNSASYSSSSSSNEIAQNSTTPGMSKAPESSSSYADRYRGNPEQALLENNSGAGESNAESNTTETKVTSEAVRKASISVANVLASTAFQEIMNMVMGSVVGGMAYSGGNGMAEIASIDPQVILIPGNTDEVLRAIRRIEMANEARIREIERTIGPRLKAAEAATKRRLKRADNLTEALERAVKSSFKLAIAYSYAENARMRPMEKKPKSPGRGKLLNIRFRSKKIAKDKAELWRDALEFAEEVVNSEEVKSALKDFAKQAVEDGGLYEGLKTMKEERQARLTLEAQKRLWEMKRKIMLKKLKTNSHSLTTEG